MLTPAGQIPTIRTDEREEIMRETERRDYVLNKVYMDDRSII